MSIVIVTFATIMTLAMVISAVFALRRQSALRSKNLGLLSRVILLMALVTLSVTFFLVQQKHESKGYAAGMGIPHVVGNSIVDASGQPLKLRGGQITDLFNSVHVAVVQSKAYPTTVRTMHDLWHMNVLRLPTCNWLWQANPTNYMSRLQTAVQQANQAGLYVILDNYDNAICNPPYNPRDTYHLPRPGMDTYMHALATTFKNYPMVLYDVYNEPAIRGRWRDRYSSADWQLWRYGGTVNGEIFIGEQKLVNAIRSAGATQIIMVEGYSFSETFYNIGANFVSDPLKNIVYEVHNYGLMRTTLQWDTDFGFMTKTYPIFVGEWALLAGGNSGNMNCSSIPQSQADQKVAILLNYMALHKMGWAAYDFNINHMILDLSYYTPSTFNVPSTTWCTVTGKAGMGTDVLRYLMAN